MFERKCPNKSNNPNCAGTIRCKSEKQLRYSEARGSQCYSCRVFGEYNPFYGKRHSKKAKSLIANSREGFVFTDEHRRKISVGVRAADLTGERNGMYGKMHTISSRKAMSEASKGVPKSEEAKRNMSLAYTKERRKLCSDRMKGAGNPMYGKVSAMFGRTHTPEVCKRISTSKAGKIAPHVKSRGYSGWFNGLHFRSSCELNFLLSNPSETWESAENKFNIPYVDKKGHERSYHPDWYCNSSKRLIEVKPPTWRTFPGDANEKQKAAKKFCRSHGMTYEIVEIPNMLREEVYELRKRGVISLEKRWEDSYQSWLRENKLVA